MRTGKQVSEFVRRACGMLLAPVLAMAIANCSSTGSSPGAGGNTSSGGSTGLGGNTGKGGSGQGGFTANGGSNGSGGAPVASGGTTSSGGATSSGGTTSAGGSQASGGNTSSGGSSAAGGATNAGGSSAAGGNENRGGAMPREAGLPQAARRARAAGHRTRARDGSARSDGSDDRGVWDQRYLGGDADLPAEPVRRNERHWPHHPSGRHEFEWRLDDSTFSEPTSPGEEPSWHKDHWVGLEPRPPIARPTITEEADTCVPLPIVPEVSVVLTPLVPVTTRGRRR